MHRLESLSLHQTVEVLCKCLIVGIREFLSVDQKRRRARNLVALGVLLEPRHKRLSLLAIRQTGLEFIFVDARRQANFA